MSFKGFAFIFFSLFVFKIWAAELVESNTSIRSLGMGGVYGPIVQDADALYFNTAMLGRTNGIRFELFDLGGGVNGLEAVNQLQTINGTNSTSGLLSYVGSRYWLTAGGRATFVMPYFGVGAYNDLTLSFKIQNPVLPEFNASYLNDTVVVVGGAVALTKTSYFGISLKQIRRVGGDQVLDSASLLNSSTLTNLASQFSNAGIGYGFALSYVYEFEAPMKPLVSVTWDDVGYTAFRQTAGAAAPSTQKDNLSVGLSSTLDLPGLDWTNAIEYRHATDYDHDLGKKIHLGTEISLPLIDLRAGLYQGYMSYGVGLSLLFMNLDVAYYDVEMGAYPGQDSQNRIVVGLNMKMGFDTDFNLMFNDVNGKKRKLKQRR